MTKAYRKITVGNTTYGWTVRTKGVDLIHIGVWDADNSGQKLNVKLNFDDPWLNFGPIITSDDPEKIRKAFNTKAIKPQEVKGIIQTALDFGWHPKEKGTELYLIWDRELKSFSSLTAEEYKALNTFYST